MMSCSPRPRSVRSSAGVVRRRAVVHQALAEYRYRDVVAYLRHSYRPRIVRRLLGTALSYLVTTGYDIGATLHPPAAALALSGPPPLLQLCPSATRSDCGAHLQPLRFRLYSSWGLSAVDIAQIVLFTTLTLWLGILTVGGGMLMLVPLDLSPWLNMDSRLLGLLLLILPVAYLLLGVRRQPCSWGTGNYRWHGPG